jgi:hypothetical protein
MYFKQEIRSDLQRTGLTFFFAKKYWQKVKIALQSTSLNPIFS